MPKNLLRILCSLLLAAGLAEVGMRVVLWARETPYSGWRAARELREILSQMTSAVAHTETEEPLEEESDGRLEFVLHPYAGYTIASNLVLQETMLERFREEGAGGDYDVFVLGGSVAAIFCGERGGASTLRAELSKDARLAGREVRIHRLAIPGYKQPQQLTLLAYLLARGARPELVIELDGVNEVLQSLRNQDHGMPLTWPAAGHWARATTRDRLDATEFELLGRVAISQARARAEVARAERFGFLHSALLGSFVQARLRRERESWNSAQEEFLLHSLHSRRAGSDRAIGGAGALSGTLEDAVACWYESSLAMENLCAPLGIRYMHALQPTLHDEGSKPLTAEERRKGLRNGEFNERVVRGYPLLREGLGRLSAAGVETIDLSYAFHEVEETLYYDTAHFSEEGNRLLAERLLPQILVGL